jgi:hypothetical protein
MGIDDKVVCGVLNIAEFNKEVVLAVDIWREYGKKWNVNGKGIDGAWKQQWRCQCSGWPTWNGV